MLVRTSHVIMHELSLPRLIWTRTNQPTGQHLERTSNCKTGMEGAAETLWVIEEIKMTDVVYVHQSYAILPSLYAFLIRPISGTSSVT